MGSLVDGHVNIVISTLPLSTVSQNAHETRGFNSRIDLDRRPLLDFFQYRVTFAAYQRVGIRRGRRR